MSDDDDVVLIKKPKQVHYGSLEEQEKARLAALAAAAKEGAEDIGGKDLGDIQVSSGKTFHFLLVSGKQVSVLIVWMFDGA